MLQITNDLSTRINPQTMHILMAEFNKFMFLNAMAYRQYKISYLKSPEYRYNQVNETSGTK